MFKVSAVPPWRSAVLTVFRGATAINGGTTVVYAVQAPQWHAPRLMCDSGIGPIGQREHLCHVVLTFCTCKSVCL